MILTNILILILGLVLLVKGSDFFVKSAASIAKRFGVSKFVIGLTLVALGTSIPELASSIAASLKGSSGLVIGNVIGSNIANIGLIIGIAAVLSVIKTRENMLKRDGYILAFVSLIFLVFLFNGIVSRIEALILLLLYLAYVFFLFEKRPEYKGKYHFNEFIDYFWNFRYLTTIKSKLVSNFKNKKELGSLEKMQIKRLFRAALIKDFMILLLGGISLVIGAKFLIEQALFFADILSIPDTLIGISLVALGTSLPELMVTISAARKGYATLAVGSIIGSNIANILLIVGVAGLIFPLEIIRSTILFSAPFMILISLLLLVFIRSNWKLKRVEGVIFILSYIAFMIFILFYI